MNVMVRLYTRHDLDLIALKKNTYFDFNKCLKMAVIAWARGESYSIPSPPSLSKKDFFDDIKPVALHFNLGRDEEDVIEKLKLVRYGFRNSFLKNLFRYYMSAPELSIYFDNNQQIMIKPAEKNTANVTPPENPIIEEYNNHGVTLTDNAKEDIQNMPHGESLNEQQLKVIQEDVKKELNEKTNETIVDKTQTNNVQDNTTTTQVMPTDNSVSVNDDNNDFDGGFDLFGQLDSMM